MVQLNEGVPVHQLIRPTGWILANVKTNSIIGTYIEEEIELWDSRKQLVAIARQVM